MTDIDDLMKQHEARQAHFDVTLTGLVIAALVEKVRTIMDETPINKERMTTFENYASRQHGIMPILDPTAYRGMSQHGEFDEVQRRIKLVNALLEYYDSGRIDP